MARGLEDVRSKCRGVPANSHEVGTARQKELGDIYYFFDIIKRNCLDQGARNIYYKELNPLGVGSTAGHSSSLN